MAVELGRGEGSECRGVGARLLLRRRGRRIGLLLWRRGWWFWICGRLTCGGEGGWLLEGGWKALFELVFVWIVCVKMLLVDTLCFGFV